MVYLGSIISIPLIYIMIKNTDYTDYFMYSVGPVALIYFLYETFKISNPNTRQNSLLP